MDENKENIVQTTVRLPQSLKQRLDEAVTSRKYTQKLTIDGAFRRAITEWLDDLAGDVDSPIQGAEEKEFDERAATALKLDLDEYRDLRAALTSKDAGCRQAAGFIKHMAQKAVENKK